MNKQEIIDLSVRHFLVERNPAGINEDGWCTYRKGCNIGILIQDAGPDILFQIEGRKIKPLLSSESTSPEIKQRLREILGVNTVKDEDFLKDLQAVHDEATTNCHLTSNGEVEHQVSTPDEFRERYRSGLTLLCVVYGLKEPAFQSS